MEECWNDPLLFTDVSCQETSFQKSRGQDHIPNGCTMGGFSLTCPDLVICAGSLENHGDEFEETPEFIKRKDTPEFIKRKVRICELSPEKRSHCPENLNSISSESRWSIAEITTAMFPEVESPGKSRNLESSLKLIEKENPNILEKFRPLISINAGENHRTVNSNGVEFEEDEFFHGGDTIRTDAKVRAIEGDESITLYQTARLGNFSYGFRSLPPGNYHIDLHFAEIIFTEGPPGMRVFDVYIQEEKALDGIDIYEKVGSNSPLVIYDLVAVVKGEEGLSIIFEGVIGSPLLSGICIKENISPGHVLQRQATHHVSSTGEQVQGETQMLEQIVLRAECKVCNYCGQNEGINKIKREYELLQKECQQAVTALEEYRNEYELKNKECNEAQTSLQRLRDELMRKSMHVSSLACAVEGQVNERKDLLDQHENERNHWIASLKELDEKIKYLKMDHLRLSKEALDCKGFLNDITNMNSIIHSTMIQHSDLEREHKDLKVKFNEGAKEKKQLYNKILEMKGNIRVFCRCRPLNSEEIASGVSMAVDFEGAKDGEISVKANGGPKKVFKFDSVFGPQADQVTVFEDTAPFAASVLDGYNVCIFAYGQTGTGKTFTMEGTEEDRGVNYQTLYELFRIIKERKGFLKYEISVSVLEVYNEQIRDLLASTSQPGQTAKRLEIRQVAEGVHLVPGLVEAHVIDMNEVWEVLQTGSNARAVGSTNANEHSSRSHCIHCVMVRGENLINGECTRSKLWLVDLAGSERVAKTDVQGERLKEAQNINKSLSALGDVISALATKSPHIPFRNSKLTHLLQDSLGGDSKTLMFVQGSPSENDVNETLCSLNFASRVRGIELGPAKKQFDNSELFKYKQLSEKAKQDIKSKDGQIKKLEETILTLESKIKSRDANTKNLQEKVKELESRVVIERERKPARQQTDFKLVEAPKLLQVTSKQLANSKNNSEPFEVITNIIQPLAENNNKPPHNIETKNRANSDNLSNCFPIQKENKSDITEQLPRTGRASLCPTARRIPITPAPRRMSLIPLATMKTAPPPPPLLPTTTLSDPPLSHPSLTNPPLAHPSLSNPPLTHHTLHDTSPFLVDCIEEATDEMNDTDQMMSGRIKGLRSSGVKINSLLRRSLHKKLYVKSPLQHRVRREERGVRVSIGGRAQRVLLGGGSKLARAVQQNKQHQREKERGWNHGTSKNVI
ncbi:kinesin-like protein KIN-14R [Amborella trichopoda]|nr:kinesin-like protein KIN-14R [Amborella trichopoda]|eukprot:XP_020518630.1 kinesin-like protein KIN-14R [Amborella trichopoda]